MLHPLSARPFGQNSLNPAQGHVDMAVDDARHNEPSPNVDNLSLIPGQPCLIPHIDEFSVLYHQGRGPGMIHICREDLSIPDYPVCLQAFLLYQSILSDARSNCSNVPQLSGIRGVLESCGQK